MTSHLMNTYGRLPIALSHGRGCRVWDTEGREYLDGLGGIAAIDEPTLLRTLRDEPLLGHAVIPGNTDGEGVPADFWIV